MKKTALSLGITIIIVLLDQTTKYIVDTLITKNFGVIEILPFLQIVNIRNKGAAFGILSGMGNVFFLIISLTAIVFLVIYLIKVTHPAEEAAFSLILGGAIGNMLDRLIRGSVVDFIDFHVNEWHWPAFNVADSALTVGIFLFLLMNIKGLRLKKFHKSESHG